MQINTYSDVILLPYEWSLKLVAVPAGRPAVPQLLSWLRSQYCEENCTVEKVQVWARRMMSSEVDRTARCSV